MDPVSLSGLSNRAQRPRWRRRRRCLLKGCGQRFLPCHPRCRYCSAACRAAARRWRRWRAQQKYRTSGNGRDHRQQQAHRYRQRRQNRPSAAARPSPAFSPVALPPCAAVVRSDGALTPCEGKRLLEKSEKVPLRPCQRPGCYVLFPAGSEYHPRRFCCVLCRNALRCVLEREARWQRRRRRGLLPPGRRRRQRVRGP
jgi:hypothetical protein